MRVEQLIVRGAAGASEMLSPLSGMRPDLVFAFGSIELLKAMAEPLAFLFPSSVRVGCSTAGEISAEGVGDDSCVVTALRFQHSEVKQASTTLDGMSDSHAAGVRLAGQLPRPGLRAVMLFGQGVAINGSAVIAGLTEVLGPEVPITGGLAGDAAAFTETWVLTQSGAHRDQMTCVGFYGERLVFSHGSFGGWTPFGPARKVTRADNNVLYELDGEPALDIYRRYLGDHADGLPSTGLLFPFGMVDADHQDLGLIRTILGVDGPRGCLTLAGDIDPSGYLRLMHANTDELVEGAECAAQAAKVMLGGGDGSGLAILVSCVGRKLVMGGRVDEEVEAVAAVFGQKAVLAGFYSNGEISPQIGGGMCKLHNQTMTITHISEA